MLVVRQETGQIKAFVNSCPHRGMQFADAGASGSGKQFLRCPCHGMSWHLDGSLREIPCRWDFPHVDDENFRLTEVGCDLWGGFVFINLDPNAPALQRYLEVLPEHFRHFPLEQRYVSPHIQKVLPGNWKMCMEASLEAYHVLATHPEGAYYTGDANAFFFPGIFLRMVYRFRPLTVDTCLHEILVLDPVPENGPRPASAPVVRLEEEDSYETVAGFDFALVFDQDTDNLRNQRAGMKASRKGAQTLGNYQEARIRRLHMTLDEYLSA